MYPSQLYGSDYVAYYTQLTGVEPRFIPNLNLDKDTGEMLNPSILFVRNNNVESNREPPYTPTRREHNHVKEISC